MDPVIGKPSTKSTNNVSSIKGKAAASFLSKSSNNVEGGELTRIFLRKRSRPTNAHVPNTEEQSRSSRPVPALLRNFSEMKSEIAKLSLPSTNVNNAPKKDSLVKPEAPKILAPLIQANTTIRRRVRPEPLRAPFIPGGGSKGIPPLEDLKKRSNTNSVLASTPPVKKEKISLRKSTDNLIAKTSNQCTRGVSPSPSLRRNQASSKDDISSKAPDFRKRSASTGPRITNNKTNQQDIVLNPRREDKNERTKYVLPEAPPQIPDDLKISIPDEIKYSNKEIAADANTTGYDPEHTRSRRTDSFGDVITETLIFGNMSQEPNDEMNSVPKMNSGDCKYEITSDSDNKGYDPEYARSRRNDSFGGMSTKTLIFGDMSQKSNDEVNCLPKKDSKNCKDEIAADFDNKGYDPEYARSRRTDSFGGINTKTLIFGDISQKPDDEINSPPKKDSKSYKDETTPDADNTGYDPEYARSRRTDSFGGINTKTLIFGDMTQEPNCEVNSVPKKNSKDFKHETTTDPDNMGYDPEYARSRRTDSFGGINTKTLIFGNMAQEPTDEMNFFPKNNSKTSHHDVVPDPDKTGYDLEYARFRRTNSFGGSNAKDLLYGGYSDTNTENNENQLKLQGYKRNKIEQTKCNIIPVNRPSCARGQGMRNLLYGEPLSETPEKSKRYTVDECSKKGIESNEIEEDKFEKLRANRTSSLGGEGIRSLMYGAPSSESSRKEKKYASTECSKQELDHTEVEQNNHDKLRANRSSCLGGETMKNLMFEETLEEESHVDSSKHKNTDIEEDKYERLRANRTSCLGGEGMRSLMYGSTTEASRVEKHDDKISKNSELFVSDSNLSNTTSFLLEIEESQIKEDQYERLRANRTSCLGGEGMRSLMYGSTTEASRVEKHDDKISKNSESFASDSNLYNTTSFLLEIEETQIKEDQYERLRTNRTSCLGGEGMRSLMYGSTTEASRVEKHDDKISKTSEWFVSDSNLSNTTFFLLEIQETQIKEDQYERLRANRTSCLGGEGMRSLMYGSTTEASRVEKHDDKISKNKIQETQIKEDQFESLRANRSSCLGGEGIRSLIYGGTPPKNNKVERNNVDPSKNRLENNDVEEDKYETLRANRVSCLGGEGMKSLMYGGNPSEISRIEKNNTKFSKNSKGEVQIDEDKYDKLRTNRTSCLGGEEMKNLMYGGNQLKTCKVEKNKVRKTDIKANPNATFCRGKGLRNLMYGEDFSDVQKNNHTDFPEKSEDVKSLMYDETPSEKNRTTKKKNPMDLSRSSEKYPIFNNIPRNISQP
ncbi:hypothetical protein HHI36_022979 [Cryptolaemus montrouzieri]|uniref:Uncharacterized protein n=1 Tax=Cryptolaemus montrouzieri TaxID=559131 RepID=A0ABD2PFJ1_9CUCU